MTRLEPAKYSDIVERQNAYSIARLLPSVFDLDFPQGWGRDDAFLDTMAEIVRQFTNTLDVENPFGPVSFRDSFGDFLASDAAIVATLQGHGNRRRLANTIVNDSFHNWPELTLLLCGDIAARRNAAVREAVRTLGEAGYEPFDRRTGEVNWFESPQHPPLQEVRPVPYRGRE